eukprot:scaffold118200_cov54-Phaeocystis_antarctica.AAC.2
MRPAPKATFAPVHMVILEIRPAENTPGLGPPARRALVARLPERAVCSVVCAPVGRPPPIICCGSRAYERPAMAGDAPCAAAPKEEAAGVANAVPDGFAPKRFPRLDIRALAGRIRATRERSRIDALHAAVVRCQSLVDTVELGRRDDRLRAGRVGRGVLEVHVLGGGRREEQGEVEDLQLHCACARPGRGRNHLKCCLAKHDLGSWRIRGRPVAQARGRGGSIEASIICAGGQRGTSKEPATRSCQDG